jgi:hypothetical protein
LFEIAGWFLFIASAIGFTVSGWRIEAVAALIGALLCLIACGVFLFPLLRKRK